MLELNEKETDLIRMVIRGASNKEIAESLGCCLRVVENRRAAAFRKLGAKSSAQAGYKYAKIEPGLIKIDPQPVTPPPKPSQRAKAAQRLRSARIRLEAAQKRYADALQAYQDLCGQAD